MKEGRKVWVVVNEKDEVIEATCNFKRALLIGRSSREYTIIKFKNGEELKKALTSPPREKRETEKLDI